ncbi:MAG: hypothetical protein AAF212_11605, partial [Verrucomicrobiota bacterium]
MACAIRRGSTYQNLRRDVSGIQMTLFQALDRFTLKQRKPRLNPLKETTVGEFWIRSLHARQIRPSPFLCTHAGIHF